MKQTIKSYDEITDLSAFKEDNTITTQNFLRVLNDYEIRDRKLTCCLIHQNGRCGQKHNLGYLIELNDGTYGLMGKDCANSKFCASENIMSGINSFKKEKDHQKRLGRVLEIADNFSQYQTKVQTLQDQINKINIFYGDLSLFLGTGNVRDLLQRYKTQSSSIKVNSYKYGESDNLYYIATHTIGYIPELFLFDGRGEKNYSFKLQRMIEALVNAVRLTTNVRNGTEYKVGVLKDKISKIMIQLNYFDVFFNEIDQTLKGIKNFWKTDLTPLCFITKNNSNSLAFSQHLIEY